MSLLEFLGCKCEHTKIYKGALYKKCPQRFLCIFCSTAAWTFLSLLEFTFWCHATSVPFLSSKLYDSAFRIRKGKRGKIPNGSAIVPTIMYCNTMWTIQPTEATWKNQTPNVRQILRPPLEKYIVSPYATFANYVSPVSPFQWTSAAHAIAGNMLISMVSIWISDNS